MQTERIAQTTPGRRKGKGVKVTAWSTPPEVATTEQDWLCPFEEAVHCSEDALESICRCCPFAPLCGRPY
jgi:hypothetical protein